MHGRGVEPRGPCPMCQDSDGFLMNCLEEGASGDPVLAGNLVLDPNGHRSQRMGLRRQTHCQEGSSGMMRRHRQQALQHWPKRKAGPTARARAGLTLQAKYSAALELQWRPCSLRPCTFGTPLARVYSCEECVVIKSSELLLSNFSGLVCFGLYSSCAGGTKQCC